MLHLLFKQKLLFNRYLEGGSLFDLLHKKHAKLAEERKLLISEDIALGMYYLHERKVMHCDLKSSNILVFNFLYYYLFSID